ncbi:MAG: ATP-dependent RNA helicase HrpA [Lautropia sp.]|nr:ATP-dependent RNA helicase HrpA [Lautropia sp.]
MQAVIDVLPVTEHRAHIVEAIRLHPVVIVSGETGSGKTTQLPKFCLEAGRGLRDPATGRGGLVGHTQPRRIAASSVANRIAEELGTPLGTDVGYKIRFNEKTSPGTRIKLMTDGILLAESQRDRLLSAYDTLIIDEAHERSLNIDFLLGYLKQLIDGPRRRDLKLIVTSATIDAARFAEHFGQPGKPAPVIEVSGRLYPVEIRYRPLEALDTLPGGGVGWAPADVEGKAAGTESQAARPAGTDAGGDGDAARNVRNPPRTAVLDEGAPSAGSGTARGRNGPRSSDDEDETDLPAAVEAAIIELWREKPGDVLVFLPGEREIRDCAEHLRRAQVRASSGARRGQGNAARAALMLSHAEIVPLYARLPAADQQRVFSPGEAPRIVLSTNVAETSLTVPRIRYVVDSGLARMLRYRIRGKVDQLLIEPVSRAAADQRAGRCGRVAEGVCVRLFDEADFLKRPAFTDPEILRSSLASVILRMSALGLSEVSAFPFLDKPSPKAIADGYALLAELGAMDDRQRLTPIGRQLARLPVDPRLARMLLAGHRSGCLAEVLVITAALSVQDPRERPPTALQAADQAHARFAVPQSDFLSWLRLWRYWQTQQSERKQRGESHRALAARIGREFLSIRRLREWADVLSQLTELVRGLGWKINAAEANPDAVHRALLTGLLGNVAHRLPDGPGWQGTHQQKFFVHPGSALAKKQNERRATGAADAGSAGQKKTGARWLMAAELVDTGRLQARTVAAIKPDWIEAAAGGLIKRSWSNPHWEKSAGKAIALERGVLYGLMLYNARRVPYEKIDPADARMLMIRQGLVAGEWPEDSAFIRHNRKVVADIERLEHKIRRPDLLVDDEALVAWFDRQIPEDICSARVLEDWYREAVQQNRDLLKLSRDALLRKDAEGVDEQRFPRLLRMHGVDFSLSYHFEPGASDDGVTLTVPLHALNQVDAERCDWLVPGMLAAKVAVLLKSLPQRWRRHLLPLDRTSEAFVDETGEIPANVPLLEALLAFLRRRAQGVRIAAADFRTENLPAHMQMNFRLVNEHGRVLAVSRQLSQLRAAYGSQAQSAFQAEFSRVAAQMRSRQAGAASVVGSASGSLTGTSTRRAGRNVRSASGGGSSDAARAAVGASTAVARGPAASSGSGVGPSALAGDLLSGERPNRKGSLSSQGVNQKSTLANPGLSASSLDKLAAFGRLTQTGGRNKTGKAGGMERMTSAAASGEASDGAHDADHAVAGLPGDRDRHKAAAPGSVASHADPMAPKGRDGVSGPTVPPAGPQRVGKYAADRGNRGGGTQTAADAVEAASDVSSIGDAAMPVIDPETVMRAGVRHTRWDFGALPELMELEAKDGTRLIGFPALIDKGDAVEISVFDDPAAAARHHRDGVVRLFMLAMSEAVKSLERDIRRNAGLELGFGHLPGGQSSGAPLAAQLTHAAIVRSCLAHGLPQNAVEFEHALQEGRQRMLLTAQAMSRLLLQIVDEHTQVRRKLNASKADKAALDDIEAQLQALFPPGFLHRLDYEPLSHYPRYLKAIAMRLDKLRDDPGRDRKQMAAMAPLLHRWRQWQRDIGMRPDREAETFRWMLEELRVSLFAQSLRTPVQVSVKRLGKMLDQREGR